MQTVWRKLKQPSACVILFIALCAPPDFPDTRVFFVHHATTGALVASATYYYQVGSDQGGWSAVISFTALPGLAAPMRYAVYADFGYGT